MMPTPSAPEEIQSDAQVIATVDTENNVIFARGSTDVDATGKALLQRHAERLKANPKLKVLLIGHTNDLGSGAYNIAISEKRVNAVYKLLRDYGALSKQLRRYSAGAEMTSKACRSPDCRRLMSRVELHYTDK